MNWILARLRERSTWKGLLVVASMGGYGFSEEVSEALTVVGPKIIEQASVLVGTVIGAWEMIRKEQKVEAP